MFPLLMLMLRRLSSSLSSVSAKPPVLLPRLRRPWRWGSQRLYARRFNSVRTHHAQQSTKPQRSMHTHEHTHAHTTHAWHSRIALTYAWIWGRFCASLTRSAVCSHDLFSYHCNSPRLMMLDGLEATPRPGSPLRGWPHAIGILSYLGAQSVSSSLSLDA